MQFFALMLYQEHQLLRYFCLSQAAPVALPAPSAQKAQLLTRYFPMGQATYRQVITKVNRF